MTQYMYRSKSGVPRSSTRDSMNKMSTRLVPSRVASKQGVRGPVPTPSRPKCGGRVGEGPRGSWRSNSPPPCLQSPPYTDPSVGDRRDQESQEETRYPVCKTGTRDKPLQHSYPVPDTQRHVSFLPYPVRNTQMERRNLGSSGSPPPPNGD